MARNIKSDIKQHGSPLCSDVCCGIGCTYQTTRAYRLGISRHLFPLASTQSGCAENCNGGVAHARRKRLCIKCCRSVAEISKRRHAPRGAGAACKPAAAALRPRAQEAVCIRLIMAHHKSRAGGITNAAHIANNACAAAASISRRAS